MKSFLFLTPLILMFAVIGLLAYIRLAPSDAQTWHIDPTDPALRPGEGRFLARDGADLASPIYAATPQTVLARLAQIADDSPRTRILAGTPEEGRLTFLTRSLLMGFPDYTTVAALPEGEGTRLVIYARLRFGQRDFDVNKTRVEGWLAALAASKMGEPPLTPNP